MTLQKHTAFWTYDTEADAYYFEPTARRAPPYTTRRVEAILDIAQDGTLAGVELVDGALPKPPSDGEPKDDK